MPSKRNADERSKRRAIRRRGGERGDAYQIVISDERGGQHSFNLTGIGADKVKNPVTQIRRKLRDDPSILEAKRDEFARRYHIGKGKLDIQNFKVRRVGRHVKRGVELVIRDV